MRRVYSQSRSGLFLLGLAFLVAASAQGQSAHVRIVQPRDGDTLTTAEVRVVLEAHGVEIAPATDQRRGTGHHHLFLDTDVTPPNEKIPQGVTGIIHLGRGQSEFTFTDVPAGRHRLIAVVADWEHVPLRPLVVDTVRFVVKR
jgi:uncharacterized protein DUF4399